MPKLMRYLPGSIVFFVGDEPEYIYLLQNGSIRLDYHNVETGKEEFDILVDGEFFGVKSSLSRCPREETASVLKESQVLCFKLDEFQNLAQSNVRLILKMMKIYSNQLRKGHKQLTNLLASKEAISEDEGLYGVAKFYSSIGKKNIAMRAYRKYLEGYPTGDHCSEIEGIVGKTTEAVTPDMLMEELKKNYNALKWKNTIDLGIEYIKKFPKSENIVEVLLLMANSNINIGQVDVARSLIAKIRTLSPKSDMMPQLEKVEAKLE